MTIEQLSTTQGRASLSSGRVFKPGVHGEPAGKKGTAGRA